MGGSSHYHCYGVHLCSEVKLEPFLSPCPSEVIPQNEIFITKSTNEGSTKYVDNETSVSSEYGYYYRKSIGLFEMFQGKKIEVRSEINNHNVDLARILLNYPLACIMLQRNMFVLHASAVEFENKTYLFAGQSLCGKSTLAACLIKNGGKLITEDTAIIRIREGKALIAPSYPMIKISTTVNEELGFSDLRGIDFDHDKNHRKGFLLPKDKFCDEERQIDFCIFPEWNAEESNIREIKFNESLTKLMSASLSIYPLDKTKEIELLKKNVEFYNSVRVFSHVREKVFGSLEKFIHLLSDI